MPRPASPRTKKSSPGSDLPFEAQLWKTADTLRGNMDASEYKHAVLGLIFLKHISDAFEEYRASLTAQQADETVPEDIGECRAANISWVTRGARAGRAHPRRLATPRGRACCAGGLDTLAVEPTIASGPTATGAEPTWH